MSSYENPTLVTDAVLIHGVKIVLIKRANEPFKGMWALPGGFVDAGETIESACIREVKEETCLDVKIKKLVGVYSDPGRDPRGHIVSISYLCEIIGGELKGADDAKEAKLFNLDNLPELAADHAKIITDCINSN